MLENMKQSAKFPIFVKTRVAEIENKYSKIDREWLILHFKMAVSFSIAAFFCREFAQSVCQPNEFGHYNTAEVLFEIFDSSYGS